MKRTIKILVILLVLISLMSCDAVVSLTGAMGKNICGYNKEEADLVLESLKVDEEAERETVTKVGGIENLENGTRFKYNDSSAESREFIVIGTTKQGDIGYSVVAWGDWAVTVSKTSDVDLSDVEDILLPSDMSLLSTLLTSSAGDYALSRLSLKVEDEKTLKAAEGTIKLLDALLDFLNSLVLPLIKNEKGRAILEFTTELKDKLHNKGDITWGDVVALEVITNLCTEAPRAIVEELFDGGKEHSSGVSSILNTLLDDMYEFLFESVEVLNGVKGTTVMFKGMTITDFISACFIKK